MTTTQTSTVSPCTTSTQSPNAARAAASQSGADPLLAELLDGELDWSPFARPPCISHFAMGLVAARRLGASDDELQAQFDRAAADDFHVARERPEWLEGDTKRIREAGISAEVSRRLPALSVSPDEQFFHAAIRLELAIDAGHAGQVANALRNWEDGVELSRGRGWTPRDLSGVAAADDPTDSMLELSLLAARAFLAEPNFSTLHVVTGTRALSSLASYLDGEDAQLLARASAEAVSSRLADLGMELPISVPAGSAQAGDERDWADLGRAAIDNGDVHTMKLVYASRLQEEATGDPIFRSVAAVQIS